MPQNFNPAFFKIANQTMQGKRKDRVGHMIQMEIGEMLLRRMKDPRLGFVTVTHVNMSADMKSACVFVSVMGSDEQKKLSLEILTKAAGFFQREVGQVLKLRYTPRIMFSLDDSIDRDMEIGRILNDIKKNEDPAP